MLAIFGSGAAAAEATPGGVAGLLHNPLVIFVGVLLLVYIFIKFCNFAKGFQLSGGLKKFIFILTGVGLVGFNVVYSMGNTAIEHGQGWGLSTYALVGSLVWVLVFAFALMADTKAE